ncbi:Nucleotidyltransferase family protein [Striga hermonthica]|uniref:polynucleotide adenylyltransferase n=1 Tax=Striga hermonthica TaxID=68872 RepID=A0A9N7MTU5_STRHE|nr:Nucleotidyltransferase family protein [Striga hermonthica]
MDSPQPQVHKDHNRELMPKTPTRPDTFDPYPLRIKTGRENKRTPQSTASFRPCAPCCPLTAMGILYETLNPLGAADDATPSQSELETYVVLRNQISLDADGSPLLESPATDYFSLDANEAEDRGTVLRNQISLDADGGPLPESAAPEVDYLSLDVNEAEDRGTSVPATPPPPSPQLAGNSIPAVERTLEGNWFRANCRSKSPMLRLHKEILDFCEFLSPTPEEQESRNAAIESVSDVVKYIWPSAEVEVFGSFKTGLYLPSSDIDVVILGSNVRSPQMGLHALSRALSQRGIAKKIQVIAKARVPIIKFVEKKSGMAFDISFDVENGPKAAEYIKDAVSKWPPLRPLCLILKVFLQQRELNEVYTGGIGSYALLSMLIAMLRTHHDGRGSPEHNLGVLLVNFFEMYGCKLNNVDVGVSCNGRGIFFPKSIKGFSVDGRPFLIAIEDPQAPDNDIGKNSFNYYQARSAFAMAFTKLTNSKTIARLGPNKSILSSIIRPDAVLLERKGGPTTGKLAVGNLFPDTSGPMDQPLGDRQDMYCNWPLNDEDEELLPRGNGTPVNSEGKSSGKKRKAPKEKRSSKKLARAARRAEDRHDENDKSNGSGGRRQHSR